MQTIQRRALGRRPTCTFIGGSTSYHHATTNAFPGVYYLDNIVQFARYPCYSQSVERCVKIVTEASLTLCGKPARDGFIRSRFEARNIMPVFSTRSDYRVSQ